jgi:monolysocardiolipin acyltransferase
MNEEREFPRFLPRTGKKVTVIIGEPINEAIEPLLAEYQRKFPHPWVPVTYGRDVQEDLKEEPPQLADMRSKIAETMRQELMKLGQKVAEVEARPPTKIEWNW